MIRKNKKQISLALSGSGFKFPAHVGALSALLDNDYQIMEIAGTSGGSVIGALYASGLSVSDMKEITFKTDFTFAMKKRIWGFWHGICSSDPLLNWLENITGRKLCSESLIPYKAISTNISDNATTVFGTFETPTISLALASVYSSSIPFIYPYKEYGGKLHSDGGLRNNIPISHLNGQYRKVGILLESNSEPISNPSIIKFAGRCIDIMLSANEGTKEELAEALGADIIGVPTCGVGMLDSNLSLDKRKELFDSGYTSVTSQL